MASANFSLQTTDRKRLIQDRLVRWIVSFGGLSVLASLIFIFVYLAFVTFPLFSEAETSWSEGKPISLDAPIVFSAIDDHATRTVFITRQGNVIDKSLTSDEMTSKILLPKLLSVEPIGVNQLLLTATDGRMATAAIKFQWQAEHQRSRLTLELPNADDWVSVTTNNSALVLSTAERHRHESVYAALDSAGYLHLVWQNDRVDQATGIPNRVTDQLSAQVFVDEAEEILLTPDGRTVYLRAGDELLVVNRAGESLNVREVVDLSAPTGNRVTKMQLLAGAHSLMVEYEGNRVWQWFDVLENGVRTLTPIRGFQFDAQLQSLIPENMSKGFAVLLGDGTMQSVYTTSEKIAPSSPLPTKRVHAAALSMNNQYALLLSDSQLYVGHLDNEFAEVSWRALWGKVWYESYPEPEFVWQTTAGSDDFEAKYSLVPIAFGTIKAALFAMLFAVPIAVFGAIYTAYFMSSGMRKVVKPTIELMEALPTVIIGFLAGLWFAPIVETHLPAVVLLLVALPLASLLMGGIWYIIPRRYTSKLPSGLHPFTLIPVIIVVMYFAMGYSSELELWLFNGDARVYLAQHGIDFDQRNALVVGFAMGFAVIPTIFTIAEDAIFSVPKHLSDGSLALGATQWQTLTHVVLLTASPGIFSAVMMGLGRAVGETMIVLMATGNTPIMDWNIFEGMRTLSATMAVELPESEVGSTHYRLLFLIALILFSFTFLVNTLAEWVRQRLREKYSAL
ncbi:ABC transporter permease subunit [Vibrio hangzhouensis]|uniref:Phosphate transport system permease protein n=1 Tax=Vibrio hangzhouensis TaxID=462991 RepID=A0A1H6AJ44_9VIBR|nr:ABC transporter permease subunit [Vibrio hangzhouensis]SEG48184.1 phosphate transport system permease protein [Vibrio hangzhouensis]